MVSTVDNLIKQIDGTFRGKERVRSAIAIIRGTPVIPCQSGLLQNRYYAPRISSVEKGHNEGHAFKNQDDSSTGKNACQASIASAVRLFDKHGMLVDNGFTQRTVVSKGAEVPRW